MPVFYNDNEDGNRRNGQPNFEHNANFRDYHEPTWHNSDTEASSTGHHIGDLFRRHHMNQAEAQNNARQNWFQNVHEQQNCEQGNRVFDRINRQNQQNAETHSDQHLKVQGDKTSNITKMLHPKIWERLYIP
jgi:hypothetical protein